MHWRVFINHRQAPSHPTFLIFICQVRLYSVCVAPFIRRPRADFDIPISFPIVLMLVRRWRGSWSTMDGSISIRLHPTFPAFFSLTSILLLLAIVTCACFPNLQTVARETLNWVHMTEMVPLFVFPFALHSFNSATQIDRLSSLLKSRLITRDVKFLKLQWLIMESNFRN